MICYIFEHCLTSGEGGSGSFCRVRGAGNLWDEMGKSFSNRSVSYPVEGEAGEVFERVSRRALGMAGSGELGETISSIPLRLSDLEVRCHEPQESQRDTYRQQGSVAHWPRMYAEQRSRESVDQGYS